MTVDLPLLEELKLADRELVDRFPGADWEVGLASLGLRLYAQLNEVRYPDVTPINCVTFGGSGGDGAHNGLVAVDGLISVSSCVVMAMPADGGFSFIVGATLFDFLCLGVGCGSFALTDVGARDSVVDLAANPSRGDSGICAQQRSYDMLAWLTERLQLRPWADKLRFQKLQDTFMPTLCFPCDEA